MLDAAAFALAMLLELDMRASPRRPQERERHGAARWGARFRSVDLAPAYDGRSVDRTSDIDALVHLCTPARETRRLLQSDKQGWILNERKADPMRRLLVAALLVLAGCYRSDLEACRQATAQLESKIGQLERENTGLRAIAESQEYALEMPWINLGEPPTTVTVTTFHGPSALEQCEDRIRQSQPSRVPAYCRKR
jgi:hypothetical protein